MAAKCNKIVVLLAGLAAVVVAVAVGLNWREIYYAFRPQARFWGRWELMTPEETESPAHVQHLRFGVMFGRSGEVAIEVQPGVYKLIGNATAFTPDGRLVIRNDGSGGILRVWDADSGSEFLIEAALQCRVSRDKIVFSQVSRGPEATQRRTSTITARYRFETDDQVILECDEDFLLTNLVNKKTITLRRVPAQGDARN